MTERKLGLLKGWISFLEKFDKYRYEAHPLTSSACQYILVSSHCAIRLGYIEKLKGSLGVGESQQAESLLGFGATVSPVLE